MLSELTIPRKINVEAALDQGQLYSIGLQHAQELSRRIWTDYNVHDPGVTALELLCYALTDLAYRASFPVKDLLASADDNAGNMQKQFFTARQILPIRPLTLLDYRKLLIDLKGVKNAWLEPVNLTYYVDTVRGRLQMSDTGEPGIEHVRIFGLYNVIVEYMDDTAEDRKEEIRKNVMDCLQANRNLCEDFEEIRAVEAQPYTLCCELELAPDADIAQVNAEILFEIQEYLAPAVRNYTLSEMLERRKVDGTRYTVDDIFEGSVLKCGFIDDEELAKAELRREIRLSDIINIIMDIEGVRAVRDIVINQAPDKPDQLPEPPANKWVIRVAPGKKAILDEERSRLVFYKRNMPVEPDSAKVSAHRAALRAALTAKVETDAVYDIDVPLGTFRQPGVYYSFQNHFPVLYGISEAGLNSTADERRINLSRQLKAYLLFFDQLMANYLAQLSRVKDLFSTDPHLERTYFYQAVDSFLNHDKIYQCKTNEVVGVLQEKVEDKDMLIERRNRFLDHLIARFAEQFTDFVHIMRAGFGFDEASMIKYKCDFLNTYPAISSERSLAYNYSLKNESDLWNTENVSGLEKRLASLLGLSNFTRRNLGSITFDVYAELDKTPDDDFRFRIRKKDTGKIVLSSSTRYVTQEQAKEEMRRAIHYGMLPSGYQRKITSDGKHYFNVIDSTGEVLARRIEYFETEASVNNAIDELMDYLRANYSDEGMYIIENILLRPAQDKDPFLPICPASKKTTCPDADPYSYRIHVILPAYGSRFRDRNFRRYVEEVIREETPAHIFPKICWVSAEDMVLLEGCYHDWIFLKSGAETAERTKKLTAFIETLYSVKNVYPMQKLHECGTGEEQKFILGETALGTMHEEIT